MDMIMVDLGELTVDSKTVVEIIGPNQPIEDFAQSCHTIPYEILTSISPRVHRTYSEEE
jgi:alanine racemase